MAVKFCKHRAIGRSGDLDIVQERLSWMDLRASRSNCGIGLSGSRYASFGFFGICLALSTLRFLANNCFAREPRLAPITGRRDGLTKAEFIAKMGIVVEEADETIFWIECLVESGIVRPDLLRELLSEANELVSIFVASRKTARGWLSIIRSPDRPIIRCSYNSLLPTRSRRC